MAAVSAFADDGDLSRDLLHTVAVRRALFEDKDLAPLNLGVKVRNRVATLWGPVPSHELARRAVELLRKLPDLIDVRNELHVEGGAERPLFLPEMAPERLRPPAIPQPPGPPGILAKWPAYDPTSVIAQPNPIAWQHVPPGPKDPRIPDDREFDVVMSALPVPPPSEPIAKLLPQAIYDLQKEKRFSQIRIEMKDDIVYLGGDSEQTQSIYELARIISRLAGVQRVIVKEN